LRFGHFAAAFKQTLMRIGRATAPLSFMAKRHAGKTPDEPLPTKLRIIGGQWRGRSIEYSGDLRTRPMKDRVREAVFNLVGPDVKGTHAIDLFAGTGALGLEALSRGAARATFIERHIPTAKLIRDNVNTLGAAGIAEALMQSAFVWAKKHEPLDAKTRWLVLCSPPFSFYTERREEMLEMIARLWAEAPPGSIFVLESDEHFDFTGLPEGSEWDVRNYPPALVGVGRKA
jgi:16S rRNA (guanine966-N2)-methyltransferase